MTDQLTVTAHDLYWPWRRARLFCDHPASARPLLQTIAIEQHHDAVALVATDSHALAVCWLTDTPPAADWHAFCDTSPEATWLLWDPGDLVANLIRGGLPETVEHADGEEEIWLEPAEYRGTVTITDLGRGAGTRVLLDDGRGSIVLPDPRGRPADAPDYPDVRNLPHREGPTSESIAFTRAQLARLGAQVPDLDEPHGARVQLTPGRNSIAPATWWVSPREYGLVMPTRLPDQGDRP